MWRKLFLGACVLWLAFGVACTSFPQTDPTSTVEVAGTAVPSAYPVPTTPTHTPTAVPTLPPTPLPSPVADDLSLSPENVRIYPAPQIYAGEKATFQLLAHIPPTINPADVTVHVLVDYQDIVSGTLNASNLQGDGVGLLEWAWDTTGLAGDHLVHVILDRYDTLQVGDENPDNNQAAITVNVQEPAAAAPLEQNAAWVTAETNCCILHVVSGTAAHRDLQSLTTAVETAVQQAAAKLGEQPARKINVYLVDRVIGQGGYAGYSIVISYLDRSYAHNGFPQVMTHEAVHVLDRQFAPERINALAEGLAVWVSEGHYKAENIDQRSAALVSIGQYIPLAALIDNFYPVQHEIGYLESAGFVKYLIDQYGWLRFRDFYADVTAEDAPTLSQAIDINLQKHFEITLADAESRWLNYLSQLPQDAATIADLETSIRYYNVMRRYQQLYDPTAYFLTAWLPSPETLEQEGNPSDLTRHPQSEINITLEVMLYAADTALRAGNYQQANILLDSIGRVLDNGGTFVDPLARTYLDVVQAASEAEYEVQQVILNGNQALVKATKDDSTSLAQLNIVLSGGNWVLWN